ncbi:MAG: serine/threonine-protein kinase, partial [Gemmatimonadaceae bacterium]
MIKSVFSAAIDAPPEERSALVALRCADDDECRIEVESLLAAHENVETIPGAREAIASAAAGIALEQDEAYRAVLEKTLSPHYEILQPLGRGGMGAVYLAKEVALERLVAIKVLRPDLLVSSESRERFKREARIVAQLSHPGILPLHTFGEMPGVWYFVMTYVRGESLAERLRARGRVPWIEAHRIMLELADALDCAHRHSVIHRDIKPANVLLDEESGRSVLADFGISKMPGFSDGLTESGMVFGTPGFMSPEQTLGLSDIDERTDIYSLGAVGYVMLSGREPFAGESPVELMY